MYRSIITAVRTRLSSPQSRLPEKIAISDKEPMRDARITDGDGPTNKTNNTIRHMVNILEAFLPDTSVILPVRLMSMEIFVPDKAITWSVPVSINA